MNIAGTLGCHGTTINVGTGAPTSANAGKIGDLAIQTDTSALWQCTSISPLTWSLVSASALGAQVPFFPQGSLSLSTAPVMTGNVINASTVNYVANLGYGIPVYNGTIFANVTFANPSIALTAGNNVNGGIYDCFATLTGGGALFIGTGPAWSSNTARSSAIQQVQGIWTNAAPITVNNGASAQVAPTNQATYLGTIYCNAAASVTWNPFPTAVGNGTGNILGVFNAYNQRPALASCLDSNSSAPGATAWQIYNANDFITFIDGLAQVRVDATHQGLFNFGNGGTTALTALLGVNLNSASATPGFQAEIVNAQQTTPVTSYPMNCRAMFTPVLGLNTLNAMIKVSATGTGNFVGSPQMALHAALSGM